MIKAKASKLSIVLFSALVLFGILTYTIVNANHAQSLSADASSAQSGGSVTEQAGPFKTDESNETATPQTVREIAEQPSAAQADDSAANVAGTPDDASLSQSIAAPSSAASAASVSSTSKDESTDNATAIASIAKEAGGSVNETSNKQSAVQTPASPAASVANDVPQASNKDTESSSIPDKSVSIASGASAPSQAASGATENGSAAAAVENGTVSGKETPLPEKAAVKSITFVDATKQKPVTVEKSKPVVQESTATVTSAPSTTYSSTTYSPPTYSAPSPSVQEPSAPAEEEYCEEEEC